MTVTAAPAGLLPSLVHRYLERAVPGGSHGRAPDPSRIRIRQRGELWREPGGRPLRFTAVQEFEVGRPGFAWRARFNVAPLLPLPLLTVEDALADGAGSLVARAGGLVAVQRAAGPATTAGQALRYLAELPWVPHAMRSNRDLAWSELDDHHVEVSVDVGGARAAVELAFDDLGNIVGASCAERPLLEGGVARLVPWGGLFSDYAVLCGIRVPTRAMVWWDLPEGRFTYWRGTVTALETVA